MVMSGERHIKEITQEACALLKIRNTDLLTLVNVYRASRIVLTSLS